MEAWFCGLHQGQNIMLYLNSCSYVIVKRPVFLFPKGARSHRPTGSCRHLKSSESRSLLCLCLIWGKWSFSTALIATENNMKLKSDIFENMDWVSNLPVLVTSCFLLDTDGDNAWTALIFLWINLCILLTEVPKHCTTCILGDDLYCVSPLDTITATEKGNILFSNEDFMTSLSLPMPLLANHTPVIWGGRP